MNKSLSFILAFILLSELNYVVFGNLMYKN